MLYEKIISDFLFQKPSHISEIKRKPSKTEQQQTPPTKNEELLTVTLERQTGRQLGIRLSGNCSEAGLFIVDIQEGSTTAADGRLQRFDRLLFVNGQDVRHCRLAQASALIQVTPSCSFRHPSSRLEGFLLCLSWKTSLGGRTLRFPPCITPSQARRKTVYTTPGTFI